MALCCGSARVQVALLGPARSMGHAFPAQSSVNIN